MKVLKNYRKTVIFLQIWYSEIKNVKSCFFSFYFS